MALTVKGLNFNRYLVENPIWVEITNIPVSAEYIRVSVARTDIMDADDAPAPLGFDFYTYNNKVVFDLAPIVKSLLGKPSVSFKNLLNDASIGTNYANCNVSIVFPTAPETPPYSYSRTFIRGGLRNNQTNVYLDDAEVLKESTKIPRWGSYPLRKYYLDGGVIKSTSLLTIGETAQFQVRGCAPIYFGFKNSKGGYSYWLFESYTINQKTSGGEYVQRREVSFNKTEGSEYTVEVTGRVTREYFKTMLALAESQEVFVYGNQLFDDSPKADSTWQKVFQPKGGNKFDFNNYEDVQDVTFSFDYNLTHNVAL
jgi:hypothetical protein